jgi:formylglycine-generating enzyme required for sulfatase activity
MQKRYPFKFLDAYTREDRDIFFGRDEEVKALYDMVFQTDLLLVQGPSGVGKTSLIKCGLASRFESHDWLALDVRRGANLNDSLAQALQQAAGAALEEEEADPLSWLEEDFSDTAPAAQEVVAASSLSRQLRAVYRKHFKPVYLIFDQFEELYTLGNKEEQNAFVENVKEILRVKLPVKIILSIREEYLGHLYDFERKVPELQRKKLRVEPMNLDKVKNVILGVGKLATGNVRLKSGEEENIAVGIFEKIKEKEKTLSIELPYLQVFLDKLYLTVTGDEHRQAEATFSLDALQSLGDIGDVLRDFLDEQVAQISTRLVQKPETIWQLLSPFVTLEGTKEPLTETELLQRLKHHDPVLVHDALEAFSKGRILRFSEQDQRYEVKHDSLAKRIHAKRSDDDIAVLEVQRLVKNQLSLKPEAREWFTEKQLGFIEPLLDRLAPLEAERDWIEKSRQHVEAEKAKAARQQEEALEKAQREAEKERGLRDEAEKARKESEKAKRRATWFARGAAALAVIGALLAVLAYRQSQTANQEKENAEKSAMEAQIARDSATAQKAVAEAQRLIADSSAVVAREQTGIAQQKTKEAEASADRARKALEDTQKALEEVVRLSLQEADELIKRLDYVAAVEKIYSLAPLGASKARLATALLEPAFWYGESGDLPHAWGILDTAYQLAGRRLTVPRTKSLENLRSALRTLDAERTSFLESRYYPKMVAIKGGAFNMGSANGEDDEKPVREVVVSDFRMSETEVTWWQYGLYVAARKGEVDMPEAPGWGIAGTTRW